MPFQITAAGWTPSTEENWWYKLLCLLTDPAKMNWVISTSDDQSFTATEDMYVFYSPGIRIGTELDTGWHYEIWESWKFYPKIAFIPSGSTYYIRFANTAMIYFKASDINTSGYGRDLWFKRLNYIYSIYPNFVDYIIGSADTLSDVDLTVGANGGIIISMFDSGMRNGWVRLTVDTTNYYFVYRQAIRVDDNTATALYNTDERANMFLFPLKAGYTWGFRVATSSFGAGSAVVKYISNLPTWWSP